MPRMVALAPQIQQWDLGQIRTGRSTPKERRVVLAVHHLLPVVRAYMAKAGHAPAGILILSRLSSASSPLCLEPVTPVADTLDNLGNARRLVLIGQRMVLEQAM